MKNTLFLGLLLILTFSCKNNQDETSNEDWISLFNGKDLNDWIIKINHHDLNENFNNTFKVKDGNLLIDYSDYDSINGEFGHIYYKEPFSRYKLRLEYRFIGEQVKGGQGWAYRNNGVMFHCQEKTRHFRFQLRHSYWEGMKKEKGLQVMSVPRELTLRLTDS